MSEYRLYLLRMDRKALIALNREYKKYIKGLEDGSWKRYFTSEHYHRRIKRDLRAMNLAQAFLNGQRYSEVEWKTHSLPPLVTTWRMIAQYGLIFAYRHRESWAEWLEEAKIHLLDQAQKFGDKYQILSSGSYNEWQVKGLIGRALKASHDYSGPGWRIE